MARVSHSTVSRALHNSPLVNRETTQIIQKLAREHGYRASLIARSLVTRETKTVGCVVTDIADPFVAEVVGGIEDVANHHGYSVFLANSHADPGREMQVVHSFEERRVDGVIVAASRVGALYMPHLNELRAPIVLVNNQHPGDFVHSVSIDNVSAAAAVTRHLIELGHRRIAYIGDRTGYQSDRERLSGYRRACKSAKLAPDRAMVERGDGKPEAGRQAMLRLLALTPRPTAVFCYNDLTALGALKALHEAGLRVPEDLSLAGFDDLFLASYVQPALTTVRQPMQAMGRRAMEILLELLSGPKPEQHERMRGELIVRESTAPPPKSKGAR